MHALRLQEGQIAILDIDAPARSGGVSGEDLKRIRCQLPLSKQGRDRNDSPLAVYVMTGNVIVCNYRGSTLREDAIQKANSMYDASFIMRAMLKL